MSIAARILILLIAVVTFGGYCAHKGIEHESNRRDALDHAAQVQVDKEHAVDNKIGSNLYQMYLTEKRAREAKATPSNRKVDNAKQSDLAVSSCPADGKSQPDTAPACVFTVGFVRLWDAGWRSGGAAAEPIRGDETFSPEERKPTAIGPRDILKNERTNAGSCTDDRARLDGLIDLLDALDLKWEREHR